MPGGFSGLSWGDRMTCNHQHGVKNYGTAFAVGITLNVLYVLIEAAFGFWSESLALLTDAGHNLSDVFGLLLAWGGHSLARVRPSRRRTYGWHGSTILAALFNALLLLAAIGAITWEAIGRLFESYEPAGMTIVVVAAIGVLINATTALLFASGRKHDLNIRGAYLHMAADAGVSVGVVIAGLGIYFTGKTWIDPVTSLLIAAVIFVGTWSLLRESFNLAIASVPEQVDPEAVQRYLEELPGVTSVHDLHIWAIGTTETALTVHLVKPELENEDSLLTQLNHELHHRFEITHTTIQIERSDEVGACKQASPDTV